MDWWVVLGVGQASSSCTVAVPAANPLTQNLATWEVNVHFPLLSASLFLVFVLFILLFSKATILPGVQVTAWQGPGSGRAEGAWGPSRGGPAPPGLSPLHLRAASVSRSCL